MASPALPTSPPGGLLQQGDAQRRAVWALRHGEVEHDGRVSLTRATGWIFTTHAGGIGVLR